MYFLFVMLMMMMKVELSIQNYCYFCVDADAIESRNCTHLFAHHLMVASKMMQHKSLLSVEWIKRALSRLVTLLPNPPTAPPPPPPPPTAPPTIVRFPAPLVNTVSWGT